MRKIILALSAVFLGSFISFAVAGLPPVFAFTFYFGDSLSDSGNYVKETSSQPCFDVSAPVTNPLGGTAPGNTWNNMHYNKYLFNFNAFPSKLGGNDFSVAGATIIPNNVIPHDPFPLNFMYGTVPGTPILTGEVGQYFLQNSRTAYPQDLYVFWGGANDIFDTIRFNPNNSSSILQNLILPDDFKTISAYISTMYNAGARNFLFIGLPDLSQTPLVAGTPNPLAPAVGAFNKPGVAAALHQLTLVWNQTLQGILSNAAHNPYYRGISIYFYNPQPIFNFIIEHPVGQIDGIYYNFTNTDKTIWCNPIFPLGNGNPDNFVFFNYIHPTSKVNTILAADIQRNAQLL